MITIHCPPNPNRSINMQALLDYLDTANIPSNDRPNVSSTPVRSMTVGMVNKRQAGYGTSVATTSDRLRLLQLLVGVANDSGIVGNGPACFTSICLNVDFVSEVHTDSHNSGPSWIVAGGDFNGGSLFVEKDVDECREERNSIEYAGSPIDGVSVEIKNSWYEFDGSCRHCTLPYSGFRVSVVYFNVPTDKCDVADLAKLQHLGFRVPTTLPFGVPYPWPYHVFICSTRRSKAIEKDTLSILFAGMSIHPMAVTLCVRDAEDAELYCRLGLRMTVSEDARGLPEQRHMCTRYLPAGSWVLHLDDDVTRVEKPSHLNLHEFVMLAFLSAQQRHVHIWGLNVSADARNLRDNYSSCLGLVCGYFFGIIAHPELRNATRLSDTVGGAAEDIERSLRCYVHSGLLRLNFATACARTRSNSGGLQYYYAASEVRQAAHNYVLRALATERPNLVVLDSASPNGCRLRQAATVTAEAHASEAEAPRDRAADIVDSTEPEDSTEHDDSSHDESIPSQSQGRAPPRHECNYCGKTYARMSDLKYHLQDAHHGTTQSFRCTACSKPFKRKKDMLLHLRSQRCHSNRGRPHVLPVAANSNDA